MKCSFALAKLPICGNPGPAGDTRYPCAPGQNRSCATWIRSCPPELRASDLDLTRRQPEVCADHHRNPSVHSTQAPQHGSVSKSRVHDLRATAHDWLWAV
jgi:hypothetical protein